MWSNTSLSCWMEEKQLKNTLKLHSAFAIHLNIYLSEGQGCRRLHGDPHIWRLLWSFHLLDALSTKPGPKQPSAGLCVPLWPLRYDWWDNISLLIPLPLSSQEYLHDFSLRRYPLSVDVLAQLQFSHHGPRRRPAQSGHQHLPGPGLNRGHHRGHLKPLPEARKAGHGIDPEWCVLFKPLRKGWMLLLLLLLLRSTFKIPPLLVALQWGLQQSSCWCPTGLWS